MAKASTQITWDDLPPRPWPEAVEPPPEMLAGWLTSLSREQLVWLLDRQRLNWDRDSRCFMRDHEGQIRQLQGQLQGVMEVLARHGVLTDAKDDSHA